MKRTISIIANTTSSTAAINAGTIKGLANTAISIAKAHPVLTALGGIVIANAVISNVMVKRAQKKALAQMGAIVNGDLENVGQIFSGLQNIVEKGCGACGIDYDSPFSSEEEPEVEEETYVPEPRVEIYSAAQPDSQAEPRQETKPQETEEVETETQQPQSEISEEQPQQPENVVTQPVSQTGRARKETSLPKKGGKGKNKGGKNAR